MGSYVSEISYRGIYAFGRRVDPQYVWSVWINQKVTFKGTNDNGMISVVFSQKDSLYFAMENEINSP